MGSKGTNIVRADFGGRAATPKKGKDDSHSVLADLTKLTKQAKDLSKKDKKNVKKFDKQFKRLAKNTGADARDFRADQTQRAAYRAMIEMILTIIPVAQEKYLESRSETTFYALRGANEQLMQLMNSIRTLDSLEEQAEHIMLKILAPAMVQIVQALVMSTNVFKSEIDSLNLNVAQRDKLHALLNGMVREHVAYISENKKAMHANIQGYLVGDI